MLKKPSNHDRILPIALMMGAASIYGLIDSAVDADSEYIHAAVLLEYSNHFCKSLYNLHHL